MLYTEARVFFLIVVFSGSSQLNFFRLEVERFLEVLSCCIREPEVMSFSVFVVFTSIVFFWQLGVETVLGALPAVLARGQFFFFFW